MMLYGHSKYNHLLFILLAIIVVFLILIWK
ncbi:MAG: hypothetical protein AB201_01985 [Parcubacteria bacterium C7867-006]|nr:MAG: hypothetical protein AB201_01985 [Parcubacteria bacterium C7867-006]